MKTLFIPAVRRNVSFNPQVLSGLPDKLHILYSIQYKELALAIKNYLGKRVVAFEQVLGCSKITPKAALLLIGSGRFHAINIAISSGKQVYIYDNGKLSQITQEEIKQHENKEKAKLSKFLLSNNMGVLVSTKPGQSYKNPEKLIKELKKKYPDKKFYLFIADNINLQELENFSCDFWVNTACPGLSLDSSKIINIDRIKNKRKK